MTSRIKLLPTSDFTGGLNLKADGFLLAPNESPDMLNVDPDPRGGFHQRWGVAPFASGFGGTPTSLWEFSAPDYQQVMGHNGATVKYSTGSSWSSAATMSGVVHAATFKDKCYMVNGEQDAVAWSGASATTLGQAWNDTDTPNTGNMPWGKFIASHMGLMFVAHTYEPGMFDGPSFPNRIRWSNPNFPESWRSYDYIDIDVGADGDEITALVPWNDHLVIFKRRSIYALYGYSPETFQVMPITRNSGAISQEAVAATDIGIFYFSWPHGVYVYTQGEPQYLFDKLFPMLRDEMVPRTGEYEIVVGWGNRRLWVAVPWRGSARNRVFVYDPTMGQGGAWMTYDLPFGPFLFFKPPGASSYFMAGDNVRGEVMLLDVEELYDEFTAGTQTGIITRFRTPWVDAQNPAIIKRFTRPEVIMRAGSDTQVFVNVYWNWDPTQARRFFTIDTTAQASDAASPPSAVEGTIDATVGWDQSNWDDSSWAEGGGGSFSIGGGGGDVGRALDVAGNELHRVRALGKARAVALEFVGPGDPGKTWGVDAVTYKYIPRAPRS